MRKLLTILLFLLPFIGKSTNYYIDNSGSDANAGTSPGAAWQTLPKVNSSTFVAGDSIFFNRNGTWYGILRPNSSGAAGNPIVYGAYGTGNDPIITGFTAASGFTNVGTNLWESAALPSTNTAGRRMVVINGVNTAMGRYPNTGWLTFQTSTTSSITSTDLTGTPDWTGADVVIKFQRWIINHWPISSQSTDTLNYTGNGVYNPQNNWGFFIQNDVRTLDTANEWFYNTSTKKITVYSTSSPTNVQVATEDTIVYFYDKYYLTFDNLHFTGANRAAFHTGYNSNIIVQNCPIDYCYDAVLGENLGAPASYFTFQNNTINQINDNGVYLATDFDHATIINNTIKNVGKIPGMGGNDDGTSIGIYSWGSHSLVDGNEVDTTGYIPIAFQGDTVTISHNTVNCYCFTKDDGGGIYTVDNSNTQEGSIISYNTILNGIGNDQGVNNPGQLDAHGVYLDDNTKSASVLYNNIANIGSGNYSGGIYLHDAHEITVRGNTVFNAGSQIAFSDDPSNWIANVSLKNNVFVAKDSSDLAVHFDSWNDDVPTQLVSTDSNYYARPVNDADSTFWKRTLSNGAITYYNLTGWKTYVSPDDANSTSSSKATTLTSDLRFEYNNTASSKVVSLDLKYISVTGTAYDAGTITIAPYSSVVLIKNGAIPKNYVPFHRKIIVL